MKAHLVKHSISQHNHDDLEVDLERTKQRSVSTMFKKSIEDDKAILLERNLVRWTVMDDIAFTTIKLSTFQQIFKDLLGVSLPFNSRKTLIRRINTEFDLFRAQLIKDLAQTCQIIVLSLDVWTSKNSKAILGVKGHWLTADF